jgi:hypothetical protein
MGVNLEIVASRLCAEPELIYRDGSPFRVLIHYGTTLDQLRNTFSEILAAHELSEILALWGDPTFPRIFQTIGDSLIISPMGDDASR